ncbi:MAG: DUF6798 domain-containing protein [Anaerolineales bacterium]
MIPRGLRQVIRFTGLSLLFAVIYAQSPLYISNQHQYFLHGLAHAGVGHLSQDWLAGTRDPTPIFSWIVEGTARTLGPAAFYLEYALLMGVYLVSLTDIVRSAGLTPENGRARAAFGVGLLAVHSAAARFALSRGLGPDWSFALESGVAAQRLLGQVFQPSVFGVFLVASVALFLRGRPYLASASAALAASVHPTYLLPAALLVLLYCAWTAWRGQGWRTAVGSGGLALILVLPIVMYVTIHLGPSGPENFRLAQEILIARIPHHAVPAKWLDPPLALQVSLLLAGMYFARGTRVLPIIAFPAGFSLALTLAQVVTGNPTLALLFPWRISVLLVPLSVAVLLARGVERLRPALDRLGPAALGLLLPVAVLALALAGGSRFWIEQNQAAADPARPMLEFISTHKQSGDVYLTPPKMDGFRLSTGAPIVVDAKSIPYFDREVLEWNTRLRLAQFFYRDRVAYIDCGLLDDLRSTYGATHLVLGPQQLGLDCGPWEEIFRDDSYAVYRLAEP